MVLTNGFVTLSGGNLGVPQTNALTWNANNILTTTGPTLTVQTSSGLLTGSFPVAGKTVPLKGALLQKENRAAGHFLGTNQTGRLRLEW